MRVFVDSGVYMDYLKGDVSLRILEVFEELLEKGEFELIFPDITKEEIYRGIPLDLGRFSKNDKLKVSMPKVPAGIEEGENYKEAKDLLDDFNKKIEEVRQESFSAVGDILQNHIEKLLKKANKDIIENREILEAAHMRKLKGNPPGKSTDPLGDEISWELLLHRSIDDKLIIITHDEDWRYSGEGKSILHPSLQKEWDRESKHEVKLFQSLAPFIKSVAPNKINKKELETERKSINPSPFFIQVGDGIRVATSSPSASLSLSNMGSVIPVSTVSASASLSSNVSQWQPITVSGTNTLVQCYSCGRFIVPSDYYGFTQNGFKCKFCVNL